MKKLVIAIVILSAILAAGIWETIYVHKVFTELDERLAYVETYTSSGSPDALHEIRELTAWWEEKRSKLEMFTFSPDIRAFSVALAETEGSLEIGDYENAQSKLQSLFTMSSNIHKVIDFNVEDII